MVDSDWIDDPPLDGDWVDDPPLDGDWVDDPPNNEANPVVTGVRNFVQGGTFGFSDEAAGGVEAIGRALGLEGLGGPLKDVKLSKDGPTIDFDTLKTAYEHARNKEREDLKNDMKESPALATTANLAGAILSPGNKLAQGMSLAKGGALIGGASGLGSSDAETLGGMAIDTAVGTGLGLAVGKGTEKLSPIIEKGVKSVGNKSKELAERFAARALGAERGTIKKLGQKKVQDLGRYAIDEGLLTPLANTDDVISRNAAKGAKGGKMMDEVYTAIDDANASAFNAREVAEKVDDQLGGFYRSPINKGEANQLDNTLESIMMRVSSDTDSISLREAQALKEELRKVANWKNNLNVTDKERMARQAYGIVNKAIDDAAESGAKTIGKEGLENLLTAGKKLYGSSEGAKELLTNKLAREQGNRIIGITDAVTGAGATGYGATTGDWETAGAIMLGKKGLEKYGTQGAALALDKLSKSLLKTPQLAQLAQKNPTAFRTMIQKIGESMNVSEKVLPRVAEDQNQSSNKPLKGQEKWAQDGAEKLKTHGLKDSAKLEELKKSKKGRELLIRASDLKVGSQAMDKVVAQIQASYVKGGR